jgi:hypothetical protein
MKGDKGIRGIWRCTEIVVGDSLSLPIIELLLNSGQSITRPSRLILEG